MLHYDPLRQVYKKIPTGAKQAQETAQMPIGFARALHDSVTCYTRLVTWINQVDTSLWWEYTTSVAASGSLKVLASAQDLPGHVAQVVKARQEAV